MAATTMMHIRVDEETKAKAAQTLDELGLSISDAVIVANDGPLGAEWKDHELKGKEWKGCRECHVGGDFLLVHRIGAGGSVVFVTTGSHSELFG